MSKINDFIKSRTLKKINITKRVKDKMNLYILFSIISMFFIFALAIVAFEVNGLFNEDDPQAYEIKKTNAPIDISSEIIVPNLVGRNYEETKKAFDKTNELKIFISSKEVSDDIQENYIISQIPQKGSFIKRDSPVIVVVSLGEKFRELPKISGMTLFEACKKLSKIGFIPKIEAQCNDLANKKVIGYDGLNETDKREYGEEVKLLIGK